MPVTRTTLSLLRWHWLALAGYCGIWAARYPLPACFLFGFLLLWKLATSSTASPSSTLRTAVLLLSCFLAGWLVTSSRLPVPPAHTPAYVTAGKPVLLTGFVRKVLPATDKRIRIILDTVQISENAEGTTSQTWQALQGGLVLTWQYPATHPAPGQTLTTKARIRPVRGFINNNSWNSLEYWGDRGVFWRAWTTGTKAPVTITGPRPVLWHIRHTLKQQVADVLHTLAERSKQTAEAYGVIPALLFGDRSSLSRDRLDLLSAASLSHSLALSGMHLGLMALFGGIAAHCIGKLRPKIFLRIPRQKLAILFAGPLVGGYIWLGGASPSLLRAGLMFACWGILLWRQQPRVLLDGLMVAVLVILISNPLTLYDIRLQLSALAIVALAFCTPLITRSNTFDQQGPVRHIIQKATAILIVSFCIQFVLLPVTSWNFNTASPWFFLNLFWLPALGCFVLPFVFLGLVAIACNFVQLAEILFSIGAFPVRILFDALDLLERMNLLYPVVNLRPHWLAMVGFAVLLSACGLWLHTRQQKKHGPAVPHVPTQQKLAALTISPLQAGLRSLLICGALLSLTPVVLRWYTAVTKQPTVHAIDVGQGQALLVELPVKQKMTATGKVFDTLFPHTARILIDGGGFSSRTFDVGKAILTPVLTYNARPHLDMLINTHPDTDHLRGLFFPLARFSIGMAGSNGWLPKGWNLVQLKKALGQLTYTQPSFITPLPVQRTIHEQKQLPGWHTWQSGQRFVIGSGYALDVLHPAPEYRTNNSNDAALVLRLVDLTTTPHTGLALFTGDIEKKGIITLLTSSTDLSAKILVLPHHGSAGSLSPVLYDKVAPVIAIASCGHLNRWGFPATAVKEALQKRNIPLITTANHGQLSTVIRGDNIHLTTAVGKTMR